MLDPMDPAKVAVPPPVVPPRGFSGILDDYDPTATFDTAEYSPGQVFLNVYDLGEDETWRQVNLVSTANNNLLLGGIFHGGVEVYGTEWCYGCTEEAERSGVQRLLPRSHQSHSYRTTVPLGRTQLCEPEVEALLERLSREWRGSEYDFVDHNCLSFCNALSQELGVNRIPGWVDRAQRVAGGAVKTARLARAMTLEVEQTVVNALPEASQVEQTVRSMLPEVPAVDADEAQRMASEAVQTLRRESARALEAMSAQTQELAEATQAQAQVLTEAVHTHTQVLGEKAQELLGDDISARAHELGERTQEQARAIGSSLWQWGQDLQRAATRALGEDQARGRASDLWDTALLGGLLGGSSAPPRRPDLERRREARRKKKEQRIQLEQDDWSNSALLQRSPAGFGMPESDGPQAGVGMPEFDGPQAPGAAAPAAAAPAASPVPAEAAPPAAGGAEAAARGPGAQDDGVAADDQE